MGRNRKPTWLLEASGAFQHEPGRRRARQGEPAVVGGLGSPHESLNEQERALWVEISSTLPSGSAGRADRAAFEQLVKLAALARAGEATIMERRLLQAYLSKFGMLPACRVSAAPSEEQDDALAQFLQRTKPQ